jgi:hypothetical protein
MAADPDALRDDLVDMNQDFARAKFNLDDLPAEFLEERNKLIEQLAGTDADAALKLEAIGMIELRGGVGPFAEDPAVLAAVDGFLNEIEGRLEARAGLDPVVAIDPATAATGAIPRPLFVRTKATTVTGLNSYLRGAFDVKNSPDARDLLAALRGSVASAATVLDAGVIDKFKEQIQTLLDSGKLGRKGDKKRPVPLPIGPLPEATPGDRVVVAMFSDVVPATRQGQEFLERIRRTAVIDKPALDRLVAERARLIKEGHLIDASTKAGVALATGAAPLGAKPVEAGVDTFVRSMPSGTLALSGVNKIIVFASIVALFNPSDDILRRIRLVPRGADISLEESARIREILLEGIRAGQVDVGAGGRTAAIFAANLGISDKGAVGTARATSSSLMSFVSGGPKTGLASPDAMNAVEKSPKLNRSAVAEYNRVARELGMIASGELSAFDEDRSIMLQVRKFIDDGGDPGILGDILAPAIQKMYELSVSASRGVSHKAAIMMTEAHARELENPRFFRHALVDPGEMKLDADQERLFRDAEGDYLRDVAGVWEHTLDPDAVRDLMLGRGDPSKLIEAAEKAGVGETELRAYFAKWAEFEGSLTAGQRKIAQDHMRHHTHETTRHIQDMVQQEAGTPGALSAQVRGALQQLERQLEDGSIGHEEALHLMEQIRGAPHDQQRPTSVTRLVTARPTPLTGVDSLFGLVGELEGEDPRASLATLTAAGRPTTRERAEIRRLEELIRDTKAQAVEAGPTALATATKALRDVRDIRSEDDLQELVRRTLPRVPVLRGTHRALADRAKSVDERAALFETIMRAIEKRGRVVGQAPREAVPTEPGPQLSERQVAKGHLAIYGEPEKVDAKAGVAHHPAGTKELHPKTTEDIKKMKELMQGEGQLFEVDLELGKMRPVELDEMVPGKRYVWIPKSGGGLGTMATHIVPKHRRGLMKFKKTQAALGGKLRFNFGAHKAVPDGFRIRGKIDLDTLFPEERQSLIEDSRKVVDEIQADRKAARRQATKDRTGKATPDEITAFQERARKKRADEKRGIVSEAVSGKKGGKLGPTTFPRSAAKEGSHHLPSKAKGGGLAPLMERNAWLQNDVEAQFPHIQGLRDKSFRQGHLGHNFHAPSHKYAPHGHHMTQKMGGSIWDDIADSSFGRAVENTSKLMGRTVIHNTIQAEEAFGQAFKRTTSFFEDPSMNNLVETLKGLGDVGMAGFQFTADQAKTLKTWAETTPGLSESVRFAGKVVPGLAEVGRQVDKFGGRDAKDLRKIARTAIALKAREVAKEHGPALVKQAAGAAKTALDHLGENKGGAFAFHGTAGKLMGYPSFQSTAHHGLVAPHTGGALHPFGLIQASINGF